MVPGDRGPVVSGVGTLQNQRVLPPLRRRAHLVDHDRRGVLLQLVDDAAMHTPAVEPALLRGDGPEERPGVQAGEVLEYPGEVEAAESADLSFEVAGRIVELLVVEGQNVSVGEVLVQLDPADYQSAVDQAQADFNAAESTYRRYQELFETGAVAAQELDVRRRNFEVSEARLETARRTLSDTNLVAPFAGRVSRTYLENFTNVQAKQPVLLLQDTTNLEVVVNVPEQDWQRARPGLTLAQRTEAVQPRVRISSLPGREFPASITELSLAADPITRTFAARVSFDPPDDVSLLPGMTASVIVQISAEQGATPSVWLPAATVLADDAGNATVWKIGEDMRASRVVVQLGPLSGADVEISSGVEVGALRKYCATLDTK